MGLSARVTQPASSLVRCPVCGNPELRKRFAAPVKDQPYSDVDPPVSRQFFTCVQCNHVSTDRYDPERYATYYQSLPLLYHQQHDFNLDRYHLVHEACAGVQCRRVLDVGCGSGSLLAGFSSSSEKFGIEPSAVAADLARKRGIRIVSADDLRTPGLRNSFDVVTCIDVAEHTSDLHGLRSLFTSALRQRGLLVIVTGACDRFAARALGRYWYYAHYAEHISFFSSRSMRLWLEPEFTSIETTPVDHQALSPREIWNLVRGWALFPLKWTLGKLGTGPARMKVQLPIRWDHMLVRAMRNEY